MEIFLIFLLILVIFLIAFFIYRAGNKRGDENSGEGRINFSASNQTSLSSRSVNNSEIPKSASDFDAQAKRSIEPSQNEETQKSSKSASEGEKILREITSPGFNWKDFEDSIPNFNANQSSQKSAAELKAQVEQLAAANFTWNELEQKLSLPNNDKAKDIVQRLVSKYQFYQAEHGKTLIINTLKRCCDNVIRLNSNATWLDGLDAALTESDK